MSKVFERTAMAVLVVGVVGAINGCGVGALQPGGTVQGAAVRGSVYGGLQPVGFSTLQLYAVGTGGYGSASTPLLDKTVMTDANGNYSLTGDYTCPSASTLVYLAATGGNPGLASGTNNRALAEIALMGECGTLTPNTFVTVNELSTVAAVYALQPFLSSISAIGAPSSNQQGLASGFVTGMSLVSLPGSIPGDSPAIATIPVATLISLGDAMSSCVNSTGDLSATAPCGRLFGYAMPTSAAPAPTDIVMALLDIARNPGHNAANIFYTISTNPPYGGGLKSAPPDWTLAINYTAPAFKGPTDLAIDAQGTVWVAALPGTGGPGSTTVSALTAASGLGASYVRTANSYSNMAIDRSGNIWLSNTSNSNLVELSPSGGVTGPFSGGGIVGPGPIAFDPAGNLWVVNNTATVSELSPGGAAMYGSAFPTGGQNGPVTIAIDATGHVWTADSSGSSISKLTNAGAPVSGSPYTNGGLASAFAIAIDSSNDGWVANLAASTLTEFASSGTPPATVSYAGDGMTAPIALTLDGANTAWAVNAGANTISALPSTSTGQTGYGSAVLTNPLKIAVDGSGNVWVANAGTGVAGSGVVTQFVGAAQPVVTPLSVAVQTARIAQKP